MIKKWVYVLIFFAFLCGCDRSRPKTSEEKRSYLAGLELAKRYKKLDFPLDPDWVKVAIEQVNKGDSLYFSPDQLKEIKYELLQEEDKRRQEKSAVSNAATQKQLDEILKIEGIKKTNSGLMYRFLKKGRGPRVREDKKIWLHYTGKLMDGVIFDSSRVKGRPVLFQLKDIIPGLKEALLLTRQGDQVEVFIPPNLAYGDSGSGKVPPNALIKFEIEILKVLNP